jgi:hypothetical protein
MAISNFENYVTVISSEVESGDEDGQRGEERTHIILVLRGARTFAVVSPL